MAIKSILVPIDGSERSWEALATALVVARRFNAHIETIYVSESAIQSATFVNVSRSLKDTVLAEEKKSLQEKADGIRAEVESFAKRRNLVFTDSPEDEARITISFSHEFGDVADVLIRCSRYHDTVAISRPSKPGKGVRRARIGSVMEAMLMESGKPVLMVPPGWKARKARHAVIAWNDSLEASRALSMTLPWLEQMAKVTIVVAKMRREGGEHVKEYLAKHGVKADIEILNRRSQSAGARLLKVCEKLDGDFLVMGGFSQSRIRQRIFGGVTDHIMGNSEIITVMVH